MATRIRFKRGETDVVKSYIDAYIGEPIYDKQTGALYIKKDDGELFPVSGIANIVDNLPIFDSLKHIGQTLYDKTTNMFYYGSNTKWQHTSSDLNYEHKNIDLINKTIVDLTFYDELAIATINLTGNLNNDVVITFPQKNQIYIITNNTTGDFNVKLKVNGKTIETIIQQGLTLSFLNDTNKIINTVEEHFNSKTNSYSRQLLTQKSILETRAYLGLGNSATLNWGEEIGNLVRLIDDGTGKPTLPSIIGNVGQLSDLIVTPNIISPTNGVGGVDPGSTLIEGSSYVSVYTAYTRDYRIFQIKKEGEEWDSTIIEFTGDVDNKEFTTLEPTNIYIVRIKDVDIKGNESKWSDEVIFNTSSVYIETPSLTIESSIDGKSILNPLLTAGTFNIIGTTSTHLSTDWRIIQITNGNIVWSSLNNTINKTSITVNIQLLTNTNYEFQVRYKDNLGNISAWRIVSKITISVMVNSPTLQIENQSGDIFRSDPLIETNSFSLSPSGFIDVHTSTDWRIIKNNIIIWSSLLNTVDKTSIRIDNNILETNNTYTFEVRHRGLTYGVSNWTSLIISTQHTFNYISPPEYVEGLYPGASSLENYGGGGWVESSINGYYYPYIKDEPINVFYNSIGLVKSLDINSLNVGEWAFGNIDGLSDNVLYIKLLDNNNPNLEDIEKLNIEPKYSITKLNIGDKSFINSTAPGYYLNTITTEPINVFYNGTQLIRGTQLDDLKQGEWGFGNLDSVGNRIYVRLPGNINPNGLSSTQLQYTVKDYWSALYIEGPQFTFLSYPYNHYGTKLEVYNLDGIKVYEKEQINEFNPNSYTFNDQILTQVSGSTSVTASNNQSNVFKLFDKNPNQFWEISGNNGWVKYKFNTTIRPYLGRYSLTIRNTTISPTQAPKNFKLQGSIDDSKWVDLDDRININNWVAGETKTFPIIPVYGTGFKYYRLLIIDNNGYPTTELSQITLYTHTNTNYNNIISISDISVVEPNTPYKIRLGYNTNIDGFKSYIFGSFINITTGNTLFPVIDPPINVYPEDNESGVPIEELVLESSLFNSYLSDTLQTLKYEIRELNDVISYEFSTSNMINQPVNITPINNEINVAFSPTLISSDFSFNGNIPITLIQCEYIIRKHSDRSIVYTQTV